MDKSDDDGMVFSPKLKILENERSRIEKRLKCFPNTFINYSINLE